MKEGKLPPFLPLLKVFFRQADINQHTAWTWGNTVYSTKAMPDHLRFHEITHCYQQKFSKIYGIYWWIRYTASKKFRYEQELPAYRTQYRWFERRIKDPNKLNQALVQLAEHLAGPVYNHMVSQSQARSDIKNYMKPKLEAK